MTKFLRRLSDLCGIGLFFVYFCYIIYGLYWVPLFMQWFFPHPGVRKKFQEFSEVDPDGYFLRFLWVQVGALAVLTLGFIYLGGFRRYGLWIVRKAPRGPQARAISKHKKAEQTGRGNE